MSEFYQTAIAFLRNKFPTAVISNSESLLVNSARNITLKVYPMIALEWQLGIKQRVLAIENLGSQEETEALAQKMEEMFKKLDASIYMKAVNQLKPTGHSIDTIQMPFAPKVILFTNKIFIPIQDVIQVFSMENTLIDVVDNSEMYKTLFISYGGLDEGSVSKINKKIKSKGIKTWFFPDDALPGEKLHRMMHDGVNKYDRVLLVCSESSLTRSGVLNEIERVLEREAKEGGADILIPITLDDFVYSDWAPQKKDIADQVKSRVITKIVNVDDEKTLEEQVKRIVNALRRAPT